MIFSQVCSNKFGQPLIRGICFMFPIIILSKILCWKMLVVLFQGISVEEDNIIMPKQDITDFGEFKFRLQVLFDQSYFLYYNLLYSKVRLKDHSQ